MLPGRIATYRLGAKHGDTVVRAWPQSGALGRRYNFKSACGIAKSMLIAVGGRIYRKQKKARGCGKPRAVSKLNLSDQYLKPYGEGETSAVSIAGVGNAADPKVGIGRQLEDAFG